MMSLKCRLDFNLQLQSFVQLFTARLRSRLDVSDPLYKILNSESTILYSSTIAGLISLLKCSFTVTMVRSIFQLTGTKLEDGSCIPLAS